MEKRFGVVSADGHCRLMHLPFDAPRVASGVGRHAAMADGHAPAEAALGKAVLNQLVFRNAVNLYKIPVSLPQQQAAG